MTNVISNEIKLNIAVTAIQSPELKTKDLAEMFSVSETSVKRAKKAFAEEAMKKLDEAKSKVADSMDHYRGYRPRNGRMAIIRSVIAELGSDAKASDMYARVSELSAENGLKPIKKTAVYVLMSQEIQKLKNK